jgi:protein tyrosine phosphatase
MYSYSSEISLLDQNKCKNRYSNILTCIKKIKFSNYFIQNSLFIFRLVLDDHSRVKLSSVDELNKKDDYSSYINANYVDVII